MPSANVGVPFGKIIVTSLVSTFWHDGRIEIAPTNPNVNNNLLNNAHETSYETSSQVTGVASLCD